MGFIQRLFSSLPNWAQQLPDHLRPTRNQIDRLEATRQKIGSSHEEFFLHIVGHPATTRKLQHFLYGQLKSQYPHMTRHQLLAELVKSRWASAAGQGDTFGLSNYTDAERERKIQEIVKRADSVDAISDLFTQEEAPYDIAPAPGFERAKQEVARILSD